MKIGKRQEIGRKKNDRGPPTILDFTSVVNLTLLYINSAVVIPAPYQVRDKLQRESSSEILDSPVSGTGQAYQARNDKQRKGIYDLLH